MTCELGNLEACLEVTTVMGGYVKIPRDLAFSAFLSIDLPTNTTFRPSLRATLIACCILEMFEEIVVKYICPLALLTMASIFPSIASSLSVCPGVVDPNASEANIKAPPEARRAALLISNGFPSTGVQSNL